MNLELEKVPVEQGECYRNCIRVLLKNPERAVGWELVHGIVTGNGGRARGLRMGHAWLEKAYTFPGGGQVWMVFDPSCDAFVPRDLYYVFADVGYTARYTVVEAATEMLRHQCPGPWDKSIAEAWHSEDVT